MLTTHDSIDFHFRPELAAVLPLRDSVKSEIHQNTVSQSSSSLIRDFHDYCIRLGYFSAARLVVTLILLSMGSLRGSTATILDENERRWNNVLLP